MLCKDLDLLRQELHRALEQDDYDTIYNLSTELDVLIVEYYKNYYHENCA